jgi:hypothetical protein
VRQAQPLPWRCYSLDASESMKRTVLHCLVGQFGPERFNVDRLARRKASFS